MIIQVEGTENDIVKIAHTSVSKYPGEAQGGLDVTAQTRSGREIKLRITSDAAQQLLKSLSAAGSMIGVDVADK